jgi:electron transfer flavoprotein alpha subunit
MAGVWILAENREHTLELLNIGRSLAAQMGTKLSAFLRQDGDPAGDFIAHGADEILLLPSIPEDQSLDAYIPVIAAEAQREDPDIFLVAASMRGKEMAARIATRLNTGLCSECISLHLAADGTTLEMERLGYGGAAVQTVSCLTRPVMATIPFVYSGDTRSLCWSGRIRPGTARHGDSRCKDNLCREQRRQCTHF